MNGIFEQKIPLVSVLIPTYNRPAYFEEALISVLKQTYPNIEIIIGDDSTDDRTEALIRDKYMHYSNISYIRNPRTLGQFENSINLINKANGEFINFLMDDDLFFSQKIEKMMRFFLNDLNKEIVLVTSFRKLIDGEGNYLPDGEINKKLYDSDVIVSGKEVGNQILMDTFNYVGEPTTVLFRKYALSEPFGTLANRRYLCSVDLASWLELLSKGKMVYLSEPLSCFRLHPTQKYRDFSMLANGIEDLVHLVSTAKQYGFLETKDKEETALRTVLNWISAAIPHYQVRNSIEYAKKMLQYQQTIQSKLDILNKIKGELNE
mgnify:CR=1 FL=1